MKELKYEIVDRIAVLSRKSSGWSKQLNLISWNDNPPKYDIRDWSDDNSKMGKGVTLTDEEAAGTNILRHDKDLKSYFVAMIILKPHVHTQLAFVPKLDLKQYEKRLKDE